MRARHGPRERSSNARLGRQRVFLSNSAVVLCVMLCCALLTLRTQHRGRCLLSFHVNFDRGMSTDPTPDILVLYSNRWDPILGCGPQVLGLSLSDPKMLDFADRMVLNNLKTGNFSRLLALTSTVVDEVNVTASFGGGGGESWRD